MVNGMRLMKEVLVNQGDKFLDRPDIPIDEEVFSKIGELSLKTCLSYKVQALTLQRSETAGDKAEPWRFFRPGWGSAMELFLLSWGSALSFSLSVGDHLWSFSLSVWDQPWNFSPSVGDQPWLTGDVPARTDLLQWAPVEGTEKVHPEHAPKLRLGEEEPGGAHPGGVPLPRGCI